MISNNSTAVITSVPPWSTDTIGTATTADQPISPDDIVTQREEVDDELIVVD